MFTQRKLCKLLGTRSSLTFRLFIYLFIFLFFFFFSGNQRNTPFDVGTEQRSYRYDIVDDVIQRANFPFHVFGDQIRVER